MCFRRIQPDKVLSNSRKVLRVIPDHDRATGFCNLDLSKNSLPLERALGICWCVENDSFQFRITLKDTPLSRRGILASISSIYDPLGLIAPVTLIGKKLPQQLCIDNSSWDDDVSDEHRMVWQKWRNSLVTLESLSIRRCFKPDNFAEVKEVTMHHFSDASSTGYGEASYIRLLDVKGNVQTSLVMAKSRVTPTKSITIPRLELSAATVSANVSRVINREINFSIKKHFFWTDSQVVLGYIKNVTKRFHAFVANRIQVIHDASNRNDWHYIESSQNPADDCSMGLSAKKFLESGRWFSGPDFLLKAEPFDRIFKFSVDDNDPEVRKPPMGNIKVHTSIISGDLLSLILERTRSWTKLNRIVATMLKWKYGRKIDVELLRKAEIAIIRLLHSTVFKDEVEQITKQSNTTLKKSSPLHKLQPFLDENQLLRVGGRLQNSNLPRNIKHPLILPKNNPLTESIIQWCHTMVKHSGRWMTLNELQQRGFMVINGNSRVRYVISKCVVCRRLRGKFGEQQMASLPEDRFQEAPPFTYAAVDMFGPFVIKERRKELKRYGALFTCMASRAVHIEVTSSLEADSFILALRRFISRRGPVRQLRSDNGTNFTGADAELVRAIHEMDNKKVEEFLLTMGTDWMS